MGEAARPRSAAGAPMGVPSRTATSGARFAREKANEIAWRARAHRRLPGRLPSTERDWATNKPSTLLSRDWSTSCRERAPSSKKQRKAKKGVAAAQ